MDVIFLTCVTCESMTYIHTDENCDVVLNYVFTGMRIGTVALIYLLSTAWITTSLRSCTESRSKKRLYRY